MPETTGGTLYVVATPIGNLEDITLRALRVLGEVDLIAAEDTRRTRKLLNHFALKTPCLSYYRENEARRGEEIMAKLLSGQMVALVSDAGTPGIADPGARLVNRVREAGLPVVPLPGASALAAFLSVAGQTGASHLFLGFLPGRSGERRKLLQSLATEPHPLVFYESPHRLLKSLADVLAVLGERRVVLARELTKIHEEVLVGELGALLARLQKRPAIKGEFVVLLAGAEPAALAAERPSGEDFAQLAAWYRDQAGLSLKDAARQMAIDLDLPRSQVYRRLLELWTTVHQGS
ncbi:16S rRNA (cytidine(1402)-2'-O)-methyltransferase [Desulfurivibrio alkaliphilus]|uniref:Ribosomal RNA small subunit methyltransferase I n=1 Tax=Desulfurivibrio alkaliphilus (strain DSM 19089 / UNIQEM U267 / AHT2) TaxID=589865 RepID=D6Z2Y3_DESAT|nr:16S rRNA (cytidine(1402)-2'-O)-methyltransferase [Desulfurivibrio alkaliphilus]ADH85908.1 Uroporphyrin-III C/tetrapyrrole (Corrin/Porphyrin) methyltransferase [Desulfurivibrio alkaliphilus AHT 2]